MVTIWRPQYEVLHAATLVRKKRNRFDSLMDDMGNRVTDKAELREMTTNYFKDLYSDDRQADAPSYPLNEPFPKLDSNRLEGIDVTVSFEEIKDTIFSMGALKAPRPDGFHAMFFQSH